MGRVRDREAVPGVRDKGVRKKLEEVNEHT